MIPRVMIVEDEEPLSLLLRYNLETEGYDVETVARGDDADTRLRESTPDLVVLDCPPVFAVADAPPSKKSGMRVPGWMALGASTQCFTQLYCMRRDTWMRLGAKPGPPSVTPGFESVKVTSVAAAAAANEEAPARCSKVRRVRSRFIGILAWVRMGWRRIITLSIRCRRPRRVVSITCS